MQKEKTIVINYRIWNPDGENEPIPESHWVQLEEKIERHIRKQATEGTTSGQLLENTFDGTQYQGWYDIDQETDPDTINFIAAARTITPEQAKYIYEILSLAQDRLFGNKNHLLKLSGIEKDGKIDTAIPIDYVRKVEELNPGFNPQYHVYDYRTATFGQFLNVAETFVQKLIEVFRK